MGRMAAHTGMEITYEDMLNDDMEYAPGIDKWTMDSPPPIVADADGIYPVPMPGKTTKHEYELNIKPEFMMSRTAAQPVPKPVAPPEAVKTVVPQVEPAKVSVSPARPAVRTFKGGAGDLVR